MIGTTTLHLDWQPKQGENEFCHTKLTPEIIKKGRSAIRVRIAAAEEEKERENEEMEVLLVKPRQSVLVPEKEKMTLMKAITELGSEDDDTLAFSRSQMEEYENSEPILIEKGKGIYVWDDKGRPSSLRCRRCPSRARSQ